MSNPNLQTSLDLFRMPLDQVTFDKPYKTPEGAFYLCEPVFHGNFPDYTKDYHVVTIGIKRGIFHGW
jgi:hypothetical protein